MQFVGCKQGRGGQIGHDSTWLDQKQDPPSQDQIEGQRPLQMFGGGELAPFGSAAALEHPVPLFISPTSTVPLDFLIGLGPVRHRQIRQEHPLRRFDSGRGIGFADPHGRQAQGRPSALGWNFRGQDGDLRPTHLHRGGAGRLADVARHLDRGVFAHRLVGHEGPQFLMALEVAIMLGADHRVEVREAGLDEVVQLVEVALAVGERDQSGLGQSPRGRGRRA